MRAFADRELLTLADDTMGFHDLQRDFLLLQADDLLLLHSELLTAYQPLLSERDAWSQLPQDEPYVWEQLVYHLCGAGDGPP